MNKLKTITGILLTSSLALAANNEAKALEIGALATSYIGASNVRFVDSSGNYLPASTFSSVIFTDTTDTSAALNSLINTATDSRSETNFKSSLDLYSSRGTGGAANGTYTPGTTTPTGNYTVSDTQLSGAILNFGSTSPATGDVYNESSLFSDKTGSGQANIRNSSTLTFTSETSQTVAFLFDLTTKLQAWLGADNGAGSSAQGSGTFSMSLSEIGAPPLTAPLMFYDLSYQFSALNPAENVALTTCTQSISSFAVAASGSVGCGSTANYDLQTNLVAGKQYKLDIQQRTDADTALNVPEPESLALLGIGLLGLVASRKKQIKI